MTQVHGTAYEDGKPGQDRYALPVRLKKPGHYTLEASARMNGKEQRTAVSFEAKAKAQ